jgi:hypothetical protein
MEAIRSRKVRKILRLEARARRFQARVDAAMARVAPAKQRAEDRRRAAQAMELELTGSQLGELRRARCERA